MSVLETTLAGVPMKVRSLTCRAWSNLLNCGLSREEVPYGSGPSSSTEREGLGGVFMARVDRVIFFSIKELLIFNAVWTFARVVFLIEYCQ